MAHPEPTIHDVLQARLLEMHFQPVINLVTGQVIAYEALVRGPQGPLATPDQLFAAARAAGVQCELDSLCRQLALERWLTLPEPRPRLFLNAVAAAVHDASFSASIFLRELASVGVSPTQVVVEVAENDDKATVDRWMDEIGHSLSHGIGLAIDDWGLEQPRVPLVLRQRPDYVKVDMRLVRGIEADDLRQALVAGMVTFTGRAGIQLVAEGIETLAELRMLLDLGVKTGQGFLFARPAWPPAPLAPEAVQFLSQEAERRSRAARGFAPLTLADVVGPAALIGCAVTAEEAEERFHGDDAPEALVVIGPGERVLGILTREQLYRRLGMRHGYERYGCRPVRELMNPAPVLLSPETPVDVAAQEVTADQGVPMAEYLVAVAGDGACAGMVSTRRILAMLSELRLQSARDQNPLTGLPGNRWIQEELARRRLRGETFALLYADLDRFKQYNDRQGFVAGDQIICVLAEVLLDAVGEVGDARDFVAHVGGDDFVLMTTADVRHLGEAILQRFAARQSEHDADVTVSLAGLYVEPEMAPVEIGRRAARLKSKAKRQGGGFALEMA